jgi:hypothetical protein
MLNHAAAYPGQIDTTDPSGYPYGRAKNVVGIGDGTGTPLEERWVSDLFGAQQALLVAAGITPSGVPDKVGASQQLDALRFVSRSETQKAQALNWPERATIPGETGAFGSNSPIGLAYAPDLGYASGGLLAAISSSKRLYSSDDGTVWTDRGLASSAANTNPWIAYGKINGSSGFLVSGNTTQYYTSVDGLSYSFVSTTAVPANAVSAWAQSLGLWVMAGDSGAICTSPTGLANTWTARSTPAAWQSNSGGAKRIVWNGSLFVVLPVSAYNKCLTSTDGVTWTEQSLAGATNTWTGLAYSSADGLWIATASSVTGSGAMVRSTDGITWGNFAVPVFLGSNDLAVIGSLWVMVTLNGYAGGLAWSANKGVTWSTVSVGNHRSATNGWNRVIAADNRFLLSHIVGAGAELALSARAL